MNTIMLPHSKRLYVVIGRRAVAGRLLDLAALLALRGPLQILDCGNRANPHPLARELRRLTDDPVRAFQNIQTSRAFTCYQVVVLLDQTAERLQENRPVLVFDLLATFYDESVSFLEGRRLLEHALQRIVEISRGAPVVVSASPPPAEFPQRKVYLDRLCRLADEIWDEPAPGDEKPQQMSLFAAGG